VPGETQDAAAAGGDQLSGSGEQPQSQAAGRPSAGGAGQCLFHISRARCRRQQLVLRVTRSGRWMLASLFAVVAGDKIQRCPDGQARFCGVAEGAIWRV
jgi:hypothetical protein